MQISGMKSSTDADVVVSVSRSADHLLEGTAAAISIRNGPGKSSGGPRGQRPGRVRSSLARNRQPSSTTAVNMPVLPQPTNVAVGVFALLGAERRLTTVSSDDDAPLERQELDKVFSDSSSGYELVSQYECIHS